MNKLKIIPKELVIIAENNGLDKNKIDGLMNSFVDSFTEAKNISNEARKIVVTDESQTDLMFQARTARLSLKDIRVRVDKTRISLKEQSLREGRAIDGMANIIKALIVPVEEHLEKQEKYAEVKELERLEKRNNERILRLSPYVEDITVYNVKDMTDLAFNSLFDTCKKAHEATKKAQEEAEKKRIAEEKAEKERQIKIQKENDKLKKDAEIREKAIKIEREKVEAERKKAQEIANKKLDAERKEKEKAQRLLDQKKKQEMERIKAENERLAKIEKDKEEELKKPDKEKYKMYIKTLFHVPAPVVNNQEISLKITEIVSYLLKLNQEKI
jgi:hypothetical protein